MANDSVFLYTNWLFDPGSLIDSDVTILLLHNTYNYDFICCSFYNIINM